MDRKDPVFDLYSVWAQGTALYGKWASSHGISYTELSILYALSHMGAVTQKTICELYGLPKQTVHNSVSDLEKRGYIRSEINESDKREKMLSFTGPGDRYCQSTLSPLFEIEEYICRNIDQDRFIQATETRRLFNTLFEKEMERSQKE